MIIIDKNGDLAVTVVEYHNLSPNIALFELLGTVKQGPIVRKTEDFRVSRQILVNNSLVFKRLLTSNFAEATQSSVTLQEDSVDAMEIWFRVMHNNIKTKTYDVSLSEMWHLVAAADKYDLNIHDLEDWYAAWYLRNSHMGWDMCQLLYPCYRFDHADGFAQATKSLVYKSFGHIVECNPTQHYELHLPSRIIQQLNAAKGRLRTVRHAKLYEPNESLLRAYCTCKEKSLYGYEKALYDIEVWPLERVAHKHTMARILDRLDKFTHKPHEDACMSCRKDYNSIVRKAQTYTKTYFDGLCLDCMNSSKTGDMDRDYWEHNNLREDEVVNGCRFQHSQATWYFSFMGRKEERDHFQSQKKQRY